VVLATASEAEQIPQLALTGVCCTRGRRANCLFDPYRRCPTWSRSVRRTPGGEGRLATSSIVRAGFFGLRRRADPESKRDETERRGFAQIDISGVQATLDQLMHSAWIARVLEIALRQEFAVRPAAVRVRPTQRLGAAALHRGESPASSLPQLMRLTNGGLGSSAPPDHRLADDTRGVQETISRTRGVQETISRIRFT
jgi:hypothetical protein